MASKSVFGKGPSKKLPAADAINEAGGKAYSLDAKTALAQVAVTGCFGNTFYATDKSQLDKAKELALQVEPEFLAKVAVYSRTRGFMKDMPAFLVAVMAAKAGEAAKSGNKDEADRWRELLWETFPQVVDNGKMLRNVMQIMLSKATGRRSFGTSVKRLFRTWFDTHDEAWLFRNSIGGDPSMSDVVRLAHPVPMTLERAALYAWFIGKDKGKFGDQEFVVADNLPEIVRVYEAFKADHSGALPRLPFEMLVGMDLTPTQWKELAVQATWAQTRQNLNAFLQHGAFGDKAVIKAVAEKLANPDLIVRAKAMPYQLLTAYLNVDDKMPREITNALQDAAEVATRNVPVIEGEVCVFPDVSGSMSSPVTGYRTNTRGKVEQHTTKTRCIDVAALVAAAFLRTNPQTVVIPFEGQVVPVKLNPRDSIMTNAQKLASIGGGSTNCSAAVAEMNRRGINPTLAVFVSDNESWVDRGWGGYGTGTLAEWNKTVRKHPEAKLACIDIQAYTTSQVPDRPGIMNVGGWSDEVFNVLKAFVEGEGQWVQMIENAS